MPIADVMNPRDLRDPLLLDADWQRVPVACANVMVLLPKLRLQAIYTPVPRRTKVPKPGSGFALLPAGGTLPVQSPRRFELDRFGKDSEYGGRASYLFDEGVDVSAFYSYHWNRWPVWIIADHDGKLVLSQTYERVQTFGLGFSKAFNEIVLRGDAVSNLGEPWQTLEAQSVNHRDHLQIVLGADYSLADKWTLGFQQHYDRRGARNLFAASVRAAAFALHDQIEPTLLIYIGLNNADRWVEPCFAWHMSPAWTLSAQLDFVWASKAPGEGDFAPLRNKHRAFAWLRYQI
jgi:hypothetical protein